MKTWSLALALLAGCAFADPFQPALYRVGTAKVKITPAEPAMLAGYASRNQPSEGVAADLFARALAIEDETGAKTVLVAADIIGFGPVISRAIKEEALKRFGLPAERLLLIGSHTHSGPVVSERALVDRPEQAKVRDAYVDGLREKVLDAVGQALGALAPATLERGGGQASFGMYRRVPKPDGTWTFGDNPDGPRDPAVPVMVVRDGDRNVRALFFTYACHCTSIRSKHDGFYQVHPDWAIACSKLESKLPGATVLFLTGCGADLDPSPRGPLSDAEKHGATMAGILEGILKEGAFLPVSGPIRAKIRRIDLPLEKPSREAFEKVASMGQRFAKDMLPRLDAGTLPASISFPIHVLHFGKSTTMVGLGGETCVEYALRLKKELGGDTIWPLGYANEVMCYIPSERVLKENGYESGWNLAWGRGIAAYQMSGSGWPTPFALGLEDRIVSAVHELIRE